MSDERMRRLERLAATGDEEALRSLQRAKQRAGQYRRMWLAIRVGNAWHFVVPNLDTRERGGKLVVQQVGGASTACHRDWQAIRMRRPQSLLGKRRPEWQVVRSWVALDAELPWCAACVEQLDQGELAGRSWEFVWRQQVALGAVAHTPYPVNRSYV